MLPGDRLVCTFLEEQAVGLRFEKWLLHVTVAPWFRLPDSSEAIAAGLREALTAISPFEVVGEGEAMFGPRKNRPVRLLKQSPPLNDIEAKVRAYLHKKRAWLVDETTKVRQEFRPHVTAQKAVSLKEGGTVVISKLYIVEQKGEYKEIVAEIVL